MEGITGQQKKKGIIIMGNIGVGKSTWIRKKYGHAEIIDEGFERNQWLEWYYKNPQKYAYLVQRMFVDIQKENIMNSGFSGNDLVVFDRGPWDLDIFIEVMFEDRLIDQGQFQDLFQLNKINKMLMCERYDLTIIVIETSIENIIERIKKRGRPMEQNISVEYLQKLDDKYRYLNIDSIQCFTQLN